MSRHEAQSTACHASTKLLATPSPCRGTMIPRAIQRPWRDPRGIFTPHRDAHVPYPPSPRKPPYTRRTRKSWGSSDRMFVSELQGEAEAAPSEKGGGSQTCPKFLSLRGRWLFGVKAPGGILRTPRHRFTREGSLSRWDVDAKYHGVANQIATPPSSGFVQNKPRPTPVIWSPEGP